MTTLSVSSGQCLKITVDMEPVGKARARTVRLGSGRVVSYTPDKTANAEAMIRLAAKQQDVYFDAGTPLELVINAWMSRPKSAKKRQYPTVKPDWDNIAKLVCDALEKYVLDNDCQIVTATVNKRYCLVAPQIEITIRETSR